MVKACIVWWTLGLCSGILVGDWLRLRFGTRKARRTALNSSQRVMQRERKPQQVDYKVGKVSKGTTKYNRVKQANKAVESLK